MSKLTTLREVIASLPKEQQEAIERGFNVLLEDYRHQIAELEHKLAQRTGRVHEAHRQIDAPLQPSVSVSSDSRTWA
jgi:hypothetical protein